MTNSRSRKREIRALAAELGVNYTTAMRILDERRENTAEAQPAESGDEERAE